jgi:hypothetical protein
MGAGALLGSGAFASPVRSLVGAHGIGMVESEGSVIPSASNYIQDGLVAMWDGVENAGLGEHNSRLNTWVDLTGNHEVTTTGTPTWTKNALRLKSSNYFSFQNTDIRNAILAHTITVEMVYSDLVYSGYQPALIGLYEHGVIYFYYNQNGSFCHQFNWAGSAFHNIKTCTDTIVYTTSSHCGNFINGEKISSWQAPQKNAGSNTSLCYINKSILGNSFNSGNLHCVRIYTRNLSDLEIAYNYDLDVMRFGLPKA